MSRLVAVASIAGQPRSEAPDWRIERLVALMGDGWLAGEWDSERHLVLPRPGGLSRVLRCLVPGCASDRYGSDLLCGRHRDQFVGSAATDLEVVGHRTTHRLRTPPLPGSAVRGDR